MTPEICVALAEELRALHKHLVLIRSESLLIVETERAEWIRERLAHVGVDTSAALKRFDDLPKNMAGEYRVFWEIDALDAETPREAAQEAWRAMRRVDSQANVFTVMPPDGMLHTIDLGEDPP